MGGFDISSFFKPKFAEWCCTYSTLLYMVSDRGSQLTSQLWAEFMHFLHIKHVTSLAYHPQSNCKVQQSFKACLRMLFRCDLKVGGTATLGSRPENMRNMTNSDTGLAPTELAFGECQWMPKGARVPCGLIIPSLGCRTHMGANLRWVSKHQPPSGTPNQARPSNPMSQPISLHASSTLRRYPSPPLFAPQYLNPLSLVEWPSGQRRGLEI